MITCQVQGVRVPHARAGAGAAPAPANAGLVYFGAGSPAELNAYIVEAVQTWQGFTASYKQRASLTPVASTPFYDLTSALSPNCLEYTVTDLQVVNLVLFHLSTSPLTTGWTEYRTVLVL